MPYINSTVRCHVCDNIFVAVAHNAKYCSPECKDRARKDRYARKRHGGDAPVSSMSEALFSIFASMPPLGSWIDSALCGGDLSPVWVSPNLGTDDGRLDADAALSLCDRCPVAHHCRKEGTENSFDGIWGGAILIDGVPQT